MPRDFPQHTERALDGVIEECLSNAECKAAFPNVRADKKAVLAKLKNGPVEVEVRVPPDRSKPTRVRLSRDLAGEAVRYMLYNPGAASRIPLAVSEAAKGNFAPLAEAAIFYRQNIVATGATGLYLSITCAEDLPFTGMSDAAKQRADDETFLGDYRLRQQREACGEWPRAAVEKGYSELVHSKVPVLIMTGLWDPVTPPLYGDRVAKGLSNSVHVVVPSGGHGFGGLRGTECIDKLKTAFIRTADPKGLETSCVGSIRRDGFVLKLPDENR
ncbi:MAG: alpha/beta hydrolase [Pyrinomonadaceae bacterium]|nr:alpha/beta hydrolase [Blastocatellia bacterium]MCW5956097.1 alpha/beta hydrolase [Pyrinomonadaceae bacterium]